jgi:hypothetical protein
MAWLQRLAKDAASVSTSVRCGGPRRVRGGSFDFELLPHVGIIWVQGSVVVGSPSHRHARRCAGCNRPWPVLVQM